MMLGFLEFTMPSVLLCCLEFAIASRNAVGGFSSDSSSREPLRKSFPELDRLWFSSLAEDPRGFLEEKVKSATEKAESEGYYYSPLDKISLPSSHLYECSCQYRGPHNRFSLPNTRAEMEDLIVAHVAERFRDSVRMLSLGSGGCLQELVLAARLAEAGVRAVRLVLVEPDKRSVSSYKDLVYFLKRMAEAYGMQVTCERFECVTDVDSEEPFDVVYAIDYEDYRPCTGCSGGERSFDREKKPALSTGNPYFAAVDLMRAANLAILAENALVVMSYRESIVSLTPETCGSRLVELEDLSEINCGAVDTFYLNGDIGTLPVNLGYFVRAGKPLLISKAILRAEDIGSVATFLGHHRICCEFVDDAQQAEGTRVRAF